MEAEVSRICCWCFNWFQTNTEAYSLTYCKAVRSGGGALNFHVHTYVYT